MGTEQSPPSIPSDAQSFFSRGIDRLHGGNWKEALSDFTEAIKLRPEVAIGYRFRSYAHADSGNVLRAIADLDEAIRLAPDEVQSYYDRAQFLLRQKLFEEALADCRKGLELDSARADLIALRGRVHAARGDSENAEADFTEAITKDPEGAANYFIWRGDLFLEGDDAERAIEDFTEAIARDPRNAYPHSRRASAYWSRRDTAAALADFAAAVEIDPKWIWVRNGRGLVHADRGEHEEAVADFNAAIQLSPDHGPSFEYRGESYYKLGKKAEALADFNEAIRLNPDSMRLYNRRAMVHYFNKDYAKAVRDHTEALKREPNHAATFNYLAWIWCTAPEPNVRNGRRALECSTRACELTEWSNPGFVDTMACAHAEMGQYTEAIKWVQKAIELCTDDQLKKEYKRRLELFRNRQPYRHTPKESGEWGVGSGEGE